MRWGIIIISACLVIPALSSAQEFTSSSFKVLDPVMSAGGYSTSTNFTLSSVISQMAIGTSTITNFSLFGGFLYFPYVSTPTVTATAGDAQASLSWTAAEASTGWSVGGYTVGQASVSGGPYSYSSVGNVLSSTRTSLTNGSTYYFVVRVEDALGNMVATSSEVSATPAASGGGSGGGGGGGGGGAAISTTTYGTGKATFSGRAYPRSLVTILKDAQLVATIFAGADGTFQSSIGNLSIGTYIFSVYSEDREGRRSSLVTFPTGITADVTSNISGIFVAPTIGVDKSEVRRGDDITIFGQSSPSSDIIISVNSEPEYFARTISDKDGIYLHNFNTSLLEYGSHSARSKASIANQLISGYGLTTNFKVGSQNILAEKQKEIKEAVRGDANGDSRVNLVDFSISAYWYNRPNPPKTADINGDGKVNLVDFSILAYNWSG